MATLRYIIDTAAPNAAKTFDAIAGRLDKLDVSLRKTREIGVGDADAVAKMARLQLRADRLKERLGSMNIDLKGAQLAEARLLELEATAGKVQDRLSGKGAAGFNIKPPGGPAWLGPALALVPAAATVGGAGLGAAAGLAGAFTAAAGAAAAFGVVAKPVLSAALTASQAVRTAQVAYSAAIENGTKKSVAYKTEQIAIAKAYAGMSPAQIMLSRQLADLSAAWDKVKAAETPVISGALQPWIAGLTSLMDRLGPIIHAVAPAIASLGTQFSALVSSGAFTTFANWIASTGSRAVLAGGNLLLSFIQGLITILPKFNPLISSAIGWIGSLGPSILSWASSKKTAADITAFMGWFAQNGPTVGGLLKNIGLALKNLAPGLATGGQLELKVISDFLGLLSRLPPGLAAPLTEAAGAALLLSKLPGGNKVLSYGVNATVSGLTGKGAESASWGKLLPGVALRFAGGAAIATVVIQAAGSLVPKDASKQATADLKKQPKAVVNVTNFFHMTNLGGWIDQYFSHPIRAWVENTLPHTFDIARHTIANVWDGVRHDAATVWNNIYGATIGVAIRIGHNVETQFDSLRHGTANTFDGTRHDIASIWNTIWANTVSRAATGVRNVLSWVGSLPGKIGGYFKNAGSWLYGAGKDVIQGLWNGLTFIWNKVTGWIGGLASWIKAHKGPVSLDKSLLYPAGRALMEGLRVGLVHGFVDIKDIITGAAGNIGKWLSGAGSAVAKGWNVIFGGGPTGPPTSGVAQWAGLVHQALAMEHLPAYLASNVLYQMSTESGGNKNAINLNDINAKMGDPSRGLMQVIASTFASYHWPGTSWDIYDPLANIAAALNYARAAYGPTLMNGGVGIGSGHGYALGTLSAAPGWARVGERGPELINFRGGEQVIPERAAAGSPASAAAPNISVRVFIGDEELTDIVRTEIRADERETLRAARSGSGTRR